MKRRDEGEKRTHPTRDSGLVANLLVDPIGLAEAEYTLTGDAFHHLIRVRRLTVGERLQLTDGRGQLARGALVAVGRREAVVAIDERAQLAAAGVALRVIVPFAKPERTAWMVEKLTELGVAEIALLLTERSTRAPGVAAVERLTRVATAALEQSFGTWLPAIAAPADLPEAIAAATAERRFILDPAGAAPTGPISAGGVALAVGPEGGFTDSERQAFQAAGFEPLRLGAQILRVETAAIAGAAVLGLGLGPTP